MEDNVQSRLDEFLNKRRPLAVGEQSPCIKRVKSLISNTKPNPEKLFIAEGIWFHKEILKHHTQVRDLVVCTDFIRSNELVTVLEKIAEEAQRVYRVSEKTFLKISERENPDGLLSVAALPQYDGETLRFDRNAIVLVLDGVEIPGNIGTMIRLADGAGVDAVFICNRKARLTHPKLIKGSLGAVLSVPVIEFASVRECHEYLTKRGFTIYLADTDAKLAYFDEPFGKNAALVMGSERYGISREWYSLDHKMIFIPMLGDCDSLNVGIAATVLVYEAAHKNGKF